jgi:hypothetical protein
MGPLLVLIFTSCVSFLLESGSLQARAGLQAAAEDAEPLLDSRIGAPDRKKWQAVRDAKDWRNPYLVIRANGVELVSRSSPRRFLQVNELRRNLTALPLDAWSYGRVVAVQEAGLRAADGRDDAPIAANLKDALAVLQALKIDVSRWPH